MITRDELTGVAELGAPAAPEEVGRIEREIRCRFPEELAQLYLAADGLQPRTTMTAAYDIGLFPLAEIQEMNEAYEVSVYLPGLLMIGLDGGGRAILVDTEHETCGVYICGTGALFTDEMRKVAATLEEWINAGFDLKDPPEEDTSSFVDIILVRTPRDGLRGLSTYLKRLDLTVPASEYRGILNSLPYPLVVRVSRHPYGLRAEEINESDDCLEIRSADA